MGSEAVVFEVESGVATITLNRPGTLNALDEELGRALLGALRKAGSRDEVRAIVLTGAGRGFCSGGDVKQMLSLVDQADSAGFFERQLGIFHDMILALRGCPKPAIAAVNGPAAGAGMNLALAADIVWAAQTAVFSQAFVKLGLVPDCGGTFVLPRLVGPSRAAEIMFTGDTVDAGRALELGIVSRVLPGAELVPEAMRLARRLAEGPTQAIARCKALLQVSFESSIEEVLQHERLSQIECSATEDFAEGVRAFVGRRPPRFWGA